MRVRRAWVVARRDLAELRTNRYVMFSLAAMPIVFAVFIPLSFGFAFAGIPHDNAPLTLEIDPRTAIAGANLTGVFLSDASIETSVIEAGSIERSVIGNSTLTGVYVNASALYNVTLRGAVVRGSNLYNASIDDRTVLIGSVVVGEEGVFEVVAAALGSLLMFFFILIPVMIPTVIASYSIVGEKANRSLEPLLASPLSDAELLTGKSLGILVPSLVVTWGSFAIFAVLATLLLGDTLGFSATDPPFLLTIFVVAPLVCLLSIAVNVMISSKVNDVRASQQLGSLVVLPLLVVFLGATAGLFALNAFVVVVFAALVALADIAVLFLATRVFAREEILVRWK